MNLSLTPDDIIAAAAILTPIGGAIVTYVSWVNNKVGKAWDQIDLLKERQAFNWTRDDHDKYRMESNLEQKALVIEIKGEFKELYDELKSLRQHFDETVTKLMSKG